MTGETIRYISLNVCYRLGDLECSSRNFSSAIRGIYFKILKKNHCFQRNINCDECSFENCLYYQIFEKKYNANLRFHPYIISHTKTEKDNIFVNYKFFGKYVDNFLPLLNAIMQTQRAKLKYHSNYYPIKIEEMTDEDNNIIFQKNEKRLYTPKIKNIKFTPLNYENLIMEFITPYRVKFKNKLCREFIWEAFYNNLHKRIHFFDKYFNNNEWNILLPENNKSNNTVEIESNMHWQENPRCSWRQHQKMSLGGLIGKVNLKNIKPHIFGLIKIGEIIHVGKQTTFGLGKYKIEILD